MAVCPISVKMLKEKQMPVPMRLKAVRPVMNKHINLRRSAFCSFALGAVLIYFPGSLQAADTPAPKPAAEPQGHQMRRYQAFARQAELPSVTITSETTLAVGTAAKVNTSQLAQLSTRDMDALAGQFGVPAPVIAKLVQRASGNLAPGAAQFAQDLRTAVVDYRFLQGEWGRYHPPTEGQPAKADALQALQAGDIAKAWALYDSLGIPPAPGIAPPQPPANLRIVASQ
jgi:hypothetical protein